MANTDMTSTGFYYDVVHAAAYTVRSEIIAGQLRAGTMTPQAYQAEQANITKKISGLEAKWATVSPQQKAHFIQQYQQRAREVRAGLHSGGKAYAQQPKQHSIWTWLQSLLPRPGQTDNANLARIGGLVAVILAVGFAFFRFIYWFFPSGAEEEPAAQVSDNYGSASYAPMRFIIPNKAYVSRGVFFGKSSDPQADEMPAIEQPGAPICSLPSHHTLIVARTRTGKGTRVIIPTLLKYMGSAIVVDPKGENAAITARARQGIVPGIQSGVHILNPWGELDGTFQKLGFPPATFNPLDILDRGDPNAVAMAQSLAGTICPVTPGSKDEFWQGSAGNILAAVFLWLADQPGEIKTLARAREITSLSRKRFTDEFMVKMAASSAYDGAIREMISPYIDQAPETFSGIISNLNEATKFLSDPQVKAATNKSSFSMLDLIRQPTTVYLIIPPDRIATQRTWLRLVITAVTRMYKRVPVELRGSLHRCMFLIDEFPALGRMGDIPSDIATMAGYGVDYTLVVQGLDQLKDHYKDASSTILSNCAFKWFCNVNDLDSAKYLSETLGKTTVQTIGKSESSGSNPGGESAGQSVTYGETGRALLLPDEVLTLGRDKAIVLHPESAPHYVRPIDYWNLPQAFARMQDEAPQMYWQPPLRFDPNPYHQPRPDDGL